MAWIPYFAVRWLALVLAIAGCRHGSSPTSAAPTDEVVVHTSSLAVDDFKPSYDKSELEKAIAAERNAIAASEQQLAALDEAVDADQLRMQLADVAVRRRFLASLEVCAADGRICPPRLDDPAWKYDAETGGDPPVEAELRFDVTGWQKLAAELFGRACACRTASCTASMDAAIDRLEQRPMPDVQSDEVSRTSIVRARECLDRLRGRRSTPRTENL